MTNDEIEDLASETVTEIGAFDYRRTGGGEVRVPDLQALRGIEAAIRKAVAQAYEEAAQIADQLCKEADDFAEQECLPLDHGGDPEIAIRIRALKDSLAAETVETPPAPRDPTQHDPPLMRESNSKQWRCSGCGVWQTWPQSIEVSPRNFRLGAEPHCPDCCGTKIRCPALVAVPVSS